MPMPTLVRTLEHALAEVPVFDVRTHLVAGKLSARGLHDLLFDPMLAGDLYAAGCPPGDRRPAFPRGLSQAEEQRRTEEAISFLPHIQYTSCFWGLRLILADLYEWNRPITPDNWRRLDSMIREHAGDRNWQHGVLDRLNIRRSLTDLAHRGHGEDDDRLQYTLEAPGFTKCQDGEYDTALRELERWRGRKPGTPASMGQSEHFRDEQNIRTIDEVHECLAQYVRGIPLDRVLAATAHRSAEIDYHPVTESEMAGAIERREQAGVAERDIYASYTQSLFLAELEKLGDEIVYQFTYGAEPRTEGAGVQPSERSIAQIAGMINRHPRLRFQCLLGSRHANQSLCALARQLPNLSLAGFWLHNSYPGAIRQLFAERLEMLPVNKQMAFFSDAACVEWVYARAMIVRNQMARVLAEKVEQGQYTVDDALALARAVLSETPQTVLRMTPRPVEADPRRYPRFRCNLEGLCQLITREIEPLWPVRIRDLSQGGAGMVIQRQVALGSQIVLFLRDQSGTIERQVPARVVFAREHSDGSNVIGCEFISALPAPDVRALLI
jgi:hypothetical protein